MTQLESLSVRPVFGRKARSWVSPGRGLRSLKSQRHAVIFIHGFANSMDAAEASYRRFLSEIDDAAWPRVVNPDRFFYAFHWPGNHPNWLTDKATYSLRVKPAGASGETLGRELAALGPNRDVVLVAHSLGCRVMLSALSTLLGESPATRPRVLIAFLMAAAVPVGDCVPGGPFDDRFDGTRYEVYHSRRDKVLKAPFRVGQLLALDFGAGRGGQAVGRLGRPVGPRWDHRVDTGFGHSEYWKSHAIAARVTRAVGVRVGNRSLAVRVADAESRDLVVRDTVDSRTLAYRRI